MYMNNDGKPVIEEVEIMYIDENGSVKLIKDKVEMFKFVRK